MRALLNELSNIVPAEATASAQSMRTTPVKVAGALARLPWEVRASLHSVNVFLTLLG